VESAIKRHGDKDVLWSAQGMLRLMPGAMQRLYRPTLDAISQAVSHIIDNNSIPSTYVTVTECSTETPVVDYDKSEFRL